MNDEIKEILDKLKDREETYQFCKQYKLAINDWVYEAHYLLDYITNLQQRIEYLERSNNRREDTIMGLRDEIVEYEDYKSRIEKAVEYIENTPLYETTYDYNMEEELEIQNVSDETASNKLLDILNGKE